MDILLKKFITFFMMPFSLVMILIIIGLILLHKNQFVRAKIILSLSFVWLFLISYDPLVNRMLYDYENIYPTLQTPPKNIEYIYVLGNGHHTDNTHPITSQLSTTAVVRLTEGIRLYRELDKNPLIIVSGHSGLYDPTPHAVMQKILALSLGVKAQNLHLASSPRDTQEEALFPKNLLGNAPFILVTSASHMQRAIRFFRQEGLHPIPAPTNHLASINHPNYLGFFNVEALRRSHILWHEILGLLWQKIKGS
jgi:uncharacterized SAM-binding protein YcdF (DUF218 family)